MFNNGFQTSLSDKLKMVECLFDLDFFRETEISIIKHNLSLKYNRRVDRLTWNQLGGNISVTFFFENVLIIKFIYLLLFKKVSETDLKCAPATLCRSLGQVIINIENEG